LVDKLQKQSDELEGDPRFGEGAGLAKSAKAAAEEVLRLLSSSKLSAETRDNTEIPHE
jgi:hypothetical protein